MGLVAAAWLLVGGGCGSRTDLGEGARRADAGDAGPREAGPMDAGSEIDRDCPRRPREGGRCEVDAARICFYPQGRGLDGCRCAGGRWVCEPAQCDGWGSDCFGSIRDDVCSGGLGCGACCSLAGRDALATWCACDGPGDRPLCEVDVICTGP